MHILFGLFLFLWRILTHGGTCETRKAGEIVNTGNISGPRKSHILRLSYGADRGDANTGKIWRRSRLL